MDAVKESIPWAWLKCAEGDWNYARIVGLIFAIAQIIIVGFGIKHISTINNGWQVVYEGIPTIGLCFLFAWEVVRGNKRLEIQVGGKPFSVGVSDEPKKAA